MKLKKKLLIIFVFVGLIFLGTYLITHRTTHVEIETPKQLMKEIPKEVISMSPHSSSSAVLSIPILMYHYVENVQDKKDITRQLLDVTPDIFERQLETLEQAKYSFLTVTEVGDILDGKMQIPDKPVVLTFDDGHRDFYTNVLPLLEKYKIKATAYIITGLLGGSDFMTKDQLQSVINSGYVDIGAHTVHHVSLKGQSKQKDDYEIGESKRWLEAEYHIPVTTFAYPSGSFDVQSIQSVQQKGFNTAVSTIPGLEQSQQNKFFLYRLRPGSRVGDSLVHLVNEGIKKHI